MALASIPSNGSRLASDFLAQGLVGAAFFFDLDNVNTKHWFFVNVLSTLIFFNAFEQMLYYLGSMQWIIKNFAWFFFETMNVSGAEAVVAAASPFLGQGEPACLVWPFVGIMTESEMHLVMTSGFLTIAGSVLSAYMSLGVPAQNLITMTFMSIPASIAISKVCVPELEEPVARGRVVVDCGEDPKDAPINALHAFAKGAVLGLVVAGQILCNVLTLLSLVRTINGLLTWIGRGFGIHHLTLQLVLGYIFYPANLGSLGIQIGVISARAFTPDRIGPSAMICGFISTLQAAGIAMCRCAECEGLVLVRWYSIVSMRTTCDAIQYLM
ncbi:Na+ dependent nucleoside transporter C-terminus-domain-containing protein [Lactarius psammicola]|nr:Na+ dependent nucleoside transporter C-terminus-domain-containing protein [Lactarius psammicola]